MKRAIFRNRLWNLAAVAASAFALAACGGGGGGGDHGGGGGLATGTFTRIFNATPTNFAQIFGDGGLGDMTVQSLHTAAEIGGSGRITKLRLNNVAGTVSATTCPNTTFRLGHSSLAALTTTFASNLNVGTPVIVLNNVTLTIPAGAAGTWFEIALSTPFEYNGVDSLVVQLDRTTTCSALVSATNRGGVIDRMVVSFTNDTTPGTADNNTITGGLFPYTTWTQFVFEGGENRQTYGGAATNTWPFTTGADLRTQTLHLASEINGSGPITGIAFQTNATTVAGAYAYTLRLGHSTLGTLGTTFANNYSGSPTVVGNAVTNFTIPAGVPAGEWIWIPIPDGVFTYNGTDNLLVDVVATAGTATNSLRVTNFGTVRRIYGNAATDTVGVPDTLAVYHIALRFNGGPMAVITPGAMTGANDLMPFYATDGKRQFLYLAAELGTKGTISKYACRTLGGPAETGFNYTVTMSHTTASTLGTTFAANLTSPVAVFSGTFDIPATLSGDWIEIPFTTPFSYNGKDNLVIQISGTGGTNGGAGCATDLGNAARYTARRVWSGLSTDVMGGITDTMADTRFTLN